jgi:hypothetical protein
MPGPAPSLPRVRGSTASPKHGLYRLRRPRRLALHCSRPAAAGSPRDVVIVDASPSPGESHRWPGRLGAPGYLVQAPVIVATLSGLPSRSPGPVLPDPGAAPDPPFLSLGPTISRLDGGPSLRFAEWPAAASCPPAEVARAPGAPEDLLRWTGERSDPHVLFALRLDEPDGAPAPEWSGLEDCTAHGESLLPVVPAPGVTVGEASAWQSVADAGAFWTRGVLLLPPPCRTPRRA